MLTTFDYEHQFINALVVGDWEYDTIFRYVFKPSPPPPKPTSVVVVFFVISLHDGVDGE